jgi:hypothetical protein
MPGPLYATAIFDKSYLKNHSNLIKSFSIRKSILIFLKIALIFIIFTLTNYVIYLIFKQVIPEDLIGEVSFDNNEIYSNVLNLLPENSSFPKPHFNNDNGIPLFITLLIIVPIIGTLINSIFAFSEEIGWRGSFLNNLNIKSNLLKNILMGVLWGIWHSPLIIAFGYNFPNVSPLFGIILMILFCVPLHCLFVVLNDKTVVSSSLLHGSINASPGLYILFHSNYHDAFSLICGIIPATSLSILTILLFFFKKRRQPSNSFH